MGTLPLKGAVLQRAEGQISSVGASEGSHHTKPKIFGIFGNNSPISGSFWNHHCSKGTNGHEGEIFGEPTLRELKQLKDRGEKWDLWSFLGWPQLQGLQPFLSLGGRSQTLLPSAWEDAKKSPIYRVEFIQDLHQVLLELQSHFLALQQNREMKVNWGRCCKGRGSEHGASTNNLGPIKHHYLCWQIQSVPSPEPPRVTLHQEY